MVEYYKESRRTGITHKKKEGKPIGLVTSCTGTAFHNMFVKERQTEG
jgi:hypothetical protein